MGTKSKKIVEATTEILKELGADLTDANFVGTPDRYEKAYREFVWSEEKKRKEIEKIFKAIFPDEYDGVVTCGPIYVTTLCPHHLLPVKLRAVIAYLPDGKVIGASKLVRIIDVCSKGLMLQEKLTREVADALMKSLKPKGVAVTLDGSHDCMTTRGVKQDRCIFRNRVLRGAFLDDSALRTEFLFDSLFTLLMGRD